MTKHTVFVEGGYRYVPGPFQYSAGVAAEPGYRIERVRFAELRDISDGFDAIESHLSRLGRPTTAFCACELRSPAPFSDQGFTEFNRRYVTTLQRWGIFRDETNPVARSNVCPELNKPKGPSFFAFSYTVPAQAGDRADSFVIAGSGEASEGAGPYQDRTVRYGDTSPAALREKALFVLAEMQRRMTALGVNWGTATATQVYTVFDFYPFLADEIVRRGAAPAGLTWYYARPPVVGLDYEMDVRGVSIEAVI